MTYNNVKPVYDLRARADYLEHGVGTKKRGHMAAGTNRLAVMYSDLGSIDDFISRGEQLAAKHARRVQAYSYIQSFATDEFDLTNPDDLQRVNDLGFLLAKKMHPDSYVLVVTHDDGHGRCAHNHIVVLNHDNRTGKALARYRTFYAVVMANNEVMAEEAQRWQPLPDPGQQRSQDSYWAKARGEIDGFDQLLAAKIQAALDDRSSTTMDSLVEQCGLRGVQLDLTERKGVTGITYKMQDDRSGRIRRRKASRLSHSFTAASLAEVFTTKQQTAQPPAAVRPVILMGGSGLFADLPSRFKMRARGYSLDDIDQAIADYEAHERERGPAPQPSAPNPPVPVHTVPAQPLPAAVTTSEPAPSAQTVQEAPTRVDTRPSPATSPTKTKSPPLPLLTVTEGDEVPHEATVSDTLQAPDIGHDQVHEHDPDDQPEHHQPADPRTRRENVSERLKRQDAEQEAAAAALLGRLSPEMRRKIQALEDQAPDREEPTADLS